MNAKTKEQPKTDEAQVKHGPAEGAGQEVIRAGNTSLAEYDYGDDAGGGLQNVTKDELRIPILNLLQPTSAMVQPGPAKLQGADPGMLLNGGTGELWEIMTKPLPFIPVHREHVFLEWTPLNLGGGFVARHSPDSDLVKNLQARHGRFGVLPHNVTRRGQKGEPLDGTEISETFSLFGLFDVFNQPFQGMLAFKSTQIKKYQAFMGRVNGWMYDSPAGKKLIPIYAHVWDLKSVPEQNKHGRYFGFSVSLHAKEEDGREKPRIASALKKTDPLYEMARGFSQLLDEGKAKADYATDRPAAAGEAGQQAGSGTPPM